MRKLLCLILLLCPLTAFASDPHLVTLVINVHEVHVISGKTESTVNQELQKSLKQGFQVLSVTPNVNTGEIIIIVGR